MPDEVHVLLLVGPTSGGIGRHVHALGGALVARGHRVTVVGPAATDAVFDWSGMGATFLPAPVGATAPWRLWAARRAVRAAAEDADVVHAHGARAGAVAALANVHPLVVTWHNTRPARLRRRLGRPPPPWSPPGPPPGGRGGGAGWVILWGSGGRPAAQICRWPYPPPWSRGLPGGARGGWGSPPPRRRCCPRRSGIAT